MRAAVLLGRWLAIYLVVLQALLTGLAAGAMAAPAGSDPFLLCLSGTDDGGAGHGDGPPGHVQHDCTACPLAGGASVLPPVVLAGLPLSFTVLALAAPGAAQPPPRTLFSPSARPRAPPARA
ncbi:DUF2946 family protein [Azorhizobium doebereinerae]|uniref:DUF2946 family protein n=1 Tax=Azorhizobium doebereinerae TaxID=281091 RepID=UPI00041161F8|nr:DUF2946 family protein [Azorhizobium doebereinerae]